MTSKPNHRVRTTIITATTLVAILLYDWWVYVVAGGEASVSAVFGRAFSWPWMGWWMLGTFGFVVGHLLAMTTQDSPGFWWRTIAVPVAAGAVGFYLTWRNP